MDNLYFEKLELELKNDLNKKVIAEVEHVKNLANIARDYSKNFHPKLLEKIGDFMCSKLFKKKKKHIVNCNDCLLIVKKKCNEFAQKGEDINELKNLFKEIFNIFESAVLVYIESLKETVKTNEFTGIINSLEKESNRYGEFIKGFLENDIAQLKEVIAKEKETNMTL